MHAYSREIAPFAVAAALGIFLALGVFAGEKDGGPEVVKKVDVERYMGTWYEIASIPAVFQRQCAGGTTASYSLKPDGTVQVVNACYTKKGKLSSAKGVAWVVDPETNAKLKVSFLPFGIKAAGGDYWVIDLGEDYEYAVVGHPKREYGWVLSRTPTLKKATLEKIEARLAERGYDFSEFKFTDQENYPPRR